MISNYIRPQDTITLVKEFVQNGTNPRKLPVVIAVQYALARYGIEALPARAYVSGLSFTLQTVVDGVNTDVPANQAVDASSIEVYGENLIAASTSIAAAHADAFGLDDLTRPNLIRCGGSSNVVGGSLLSQLNGRPVQIGDPVLIDDGVAGFGGSSKIVRQVVGFMGRIAAATRGTDVSRADGLYAAGLYNPLTTTASFAVISVALASGQASTVLTSTGGVFGSGGTDALKAGALYAGKFSELYTIRVLETVGVGVVKVSITSASGKFNVAAHTTVNASGAYTIVGVANLCGLSLSIAAVAALQVGDVLQFQAIGAYTRATSTAFFSAVGTYTGTVDTTLVVSVKEGATLATAAHKLTVFDSAGVFAPADVALASINTSTNIVVLGGVTFRILATGGLRTGDTFFIHLVASKASTVNFDGVILDGPAADTSLFTNVATKLTTIEFARYVNGQIDSTFSLTTPWTYTALTKTVALGTLSVDNGYGTRWALLSGYGNVYAGFRAAVQPGVLEGLQFCNTASQLSLAGPADAANPLGKAVSNMFSGSRGQRIAYLRLSSETESAATAALRKIEATDSVYYLNPQVSTAELRAQFLQHCESLSSPEKKNFRKAYFGIDSPGRRAVLLRQGNSQPYMATVGNGSNGSNHVTILQAVNLSSLRVRDGDEVIFPSLNPAVPFVTSVKLVVSATEFEIETPLPAGVAAPGLPIEIWKLDTPRNNLDFVIDAAKALASYRATLVWCEGGYLGNTAASSASIAAEIAGLRSVLPPQSGVTQTELRSVTSAAPMYLRYTPEELDEAAANGVFVVAQEAEGGPVFIRHQLTTETEAGILAWEDSVGINHDMIAFGVKDLFTAYRGNRNRTADTRRDIEDELFQYMVGLTQSDIGDTNGPQITDFQNKNAENGKVTVEADPEFADRFRTFVSAGVPVPLNGINHTIRIHLSDLV